MTGIGRPEMHMERMGRLRQGRGMILWARASVHPDNPPCGTPTGTRRRWTRSATAGSTSAGPVAAGQTAPQPSPQPPQPTLMTWLLVLVEAANAAWGGVAVQQPPQVLPLGRRIRREVGHHRPCRRRGAAPARLAAWSIRRAPLRALRPDRSGARAGARGPRQVLPLVSQYGQARRICRSRAGVLPAHSRIPAPW